MTSVLSSLFQFFQIFKAAWSALSAGCCTYRLPFSRWWLLGGNKLKASKFFVSISLVVAFWGWVFLWLISNWIKLLLNHKSMMYVSLKLFLWKRRSQDCESKLLRNELVFSCDLCTSYKCKILAHPATLPLLRLWRPVLNTLNLFKTYTILFQYLSIKLCVHLKI